MKRQEKLNWYKKEFESINKDIETKKSLSHYDFLRIRNFKLQNSSSEQESHIEKITKDAFILAKEDEIEGAINKLQELDGVGVPIASTILAMKYPDRFAIIDRKVISALDNKDKDNWLKDYLTSSKTYREYLLLMRKNASKEGMALRDYERGLWEEE